MAADQPRAGTGAAGDVPSDPRARDRGPAARRRPKRGRRAAVVGLFVLMAGLLFGLGLFMIGERRALFAPDFEMYTEFTRLGGIQKGAIVRVAGADAGEVEEIHVPRSPSEKFRVKLRVREEMHGLVRTDSVASIQTEGLLGNRFIQIEAGTDAAPELPDGGTIRGSELYDFNDLLGQASRTLTSIEGLVGEVRAAVDTTLGGITETTDEAQQIMRGLDRELRVILGQGQTVVNEIGIIVKDIRAGKGTLGRLANDPELYDRANVLLKDAQGTIAKLNEAAEQAKQLVTEMRSDTGPVQGAIADLRQTLSGAREAMADLSESTEALKRNFFFRGFFARRGYYDLDDISVDEYRKGALEARDRRVIRIWLRRDVLFTRNERGDEILTEDGKARLESAMSEFLRQPPDSPIVVEGYAAAPTYDQRYTASRRRAAMAREHLVTRMQLDPTRVGLMPLGSDAPTSPDKGTWDGVAIAIFLRTER